MWEPFGALSVPDEDLSLGRQHSANIFRPDARRADDPHRPQRFVHLIDTQAVKPGYFLRTRVQQATSAEVTNHSGEGVAAVGAHFQRRLDLDRAIWIDARCNLFVELPGTLVLSASVTEATGYMPSAARTRVTGCTFQHWILFEAVFGSFNDFLVSHSHHA